MLRAIVLGLVQGLTEFLPVSSSAHLVLVPYVLGWNLGPTFGVPFDVAVHLGTALAILVYFARDIGGMLAGAARMLARRGRDEDRDHARLLGLLAIGSIPAALVGFLARGLFEDLFDRPPLVAVLLLVTAGLLVAAEWASRRIRHRRGLERIGVVDAVAIGLFQAVAIAPGISRSGATIAAGMFRGLERDASARFAFLLGLPAILGAGILEISDFEPGADVGRIVVGAVVAAVVGFASIAFLIRYLRTRTLTPFAVYCTLAAAVALGFYFQVR